MSSGPVKAAATVMLSRQRPVVVARDRGVDLWLLAACLALIVVGTIEVFSTSALYALGKHGDSMYFLKRQLVFLGLGMGALWVGAQTDYRWLRRWTYPLLALSLILLVAVLLFGGRINGARRWILLGPLSFQPVEFAKLALVCYLAYSLSKKGDKVKNFSIGFAPHLVVCAIMMVLLLKQPDLGSSIILGATTLTLLFVAGTKLTWLALVLLSSAPIAYHFITDTPWRLQRFMAYFNPEAYREGVAYQIVQAGIAVGSGGVTGTGLGQGRQQLGFLPEAHSDFILAGVGEELGFVGIALILVLFGIILWRGFLAAARARDPFGAYLAIGITTNFAVQVLMNTGVVLGLLPAKGLTLPLVSYGGTSLVASLFLIGVLLNIARGRSYDTRNREKPRQNTKARPTARRRKRRAVIVA